MEERTTCRQYDAFAPDYHWLFSGAECEPFFETHDELLGSLEPGAKILDCSCGIGMQAVALARKGYKVWAADASAGMVAEARRRAGEAGVAIPIARCGWEELAGRFAERFDLAFCCGNSIGHCCSEEEMIRALRGMREVLAEDGKMVLDSRNWEKLRQEKPRFSVLALREREGKKCIPLYVWNFPEKWEEAHVVVVVLVFEEGGRTWHRSYPITYYPFRADELMRRLKTAGFAEAESDYEEAKDDYRALARCKGS